MHLFRVTFCHPCRSHSYRWQMCNPPVITHQWPPSLLFWAHFSEQASVVLLSGDPAPPPTRSAGCKKRKPRRKKLLLLSDSKGAEDSICPPLRPEVQAGQPWCPASASSPQASGLSLAAAVMVPSPAPYMFPALSLPAVTSVGGEGAASGPAPPGPPEPPVPRGSWSLPALPSACLDPFMNLFLHDPPVCALLSPSFASDPFLGAPGTSELPPSVSALAADLDAASSFISERPGEEKWGAQSEAHPLGLSGASSPLQLSLLRGDRPRSGEASGPVRTNVCPEAERVSGADFAHTGEKICVCPCIKIEVWALGLNPGGPGGKPAPQPRSRLGPAKTSF